MAVSAELSAKIISPTIPIDSKLVITARNADNPIIQKFMRDRRVNLGITPDGRVSLQSPRGTNLLGFDDFLKKSGVDVNNPCALDMPRNDNAPTSPQKRATQNQLNKIKSALESKRNKGWDNLRQQRLGSAQPLIEEQTSTSGTKSPKFKPVMLVMFTIFRQVGVDIKVVLLDPARRLSRSGYMLARDLLFGKIYHDDDAYAFAVKEARMAQAAPSKQAIVEVQSNAPQKDTVPQMVWSQNAKGINKTATTRYRFQTAYDKQGVFTNGPKNRAQ